MTRRNKYVVGIGLAVALVAYALVPAIAAWHVKRELAKIGFPDAQLEVESIGVNHLALRDVRLGNGIDVGSVEMNRGLSLLWKHLDKVSIHDATVTPAAAARVAPVVQRSQAKPRTSPVRLDVDVTVRDPSSQGWSAHGQGHLVWGSELELEHGRVEVTVARAQLGRVAVEDGSVVANLEGNLSSLDVRGNATVHAARVAVGPVAATDITLPVTFDRSHAQTASGRALALGGVLSIDGSLGTESGANVVIRARDLRLAQLLEPARKVTGAGIVDGSLQLRGSLDGWTFTNGELHARGAGTIRVSDQALRERVAAVHKPLAVHAAIAEALLDFRYDALAIELGPEHVQLAIRGSGVRNHQALDITVRAHDLRGAP